MNINQNFIKHSKKFDWYLMGAAILVNEKSETRSQVNSRQFRAFKYQMLEIHQKQIIHYSGNDHMINFALIQSRSYHANLKKPRSDPELFSNYRTLSLLPFFQKGEGCFIAANRPSRKAKRARKISVRL